MISCPHYICPYEDQDTDLDHVYLYEKQRLQAEEAQRYEETGHGFQHGEYERRIREICDRIGF